MLVLVLVLVVRGRGHGSGRLGIRRARRPCHLCFVRLGEPGHRWGGGDSEEGGGCALGGLAVPCSIEGGGVEDVGQGFDGGGAPFGGLDSGAGLGGALDEGDAILDFGCGHPLGDGGYGGVEVVGDDGEGEVGAEDLAEEVGFVGGWGEDG